MKRINSLVLTLCTMLCSTGARADAPQTTNNTSKDGVTSWQSPSDHFHLRITKGTSFVLEDNDTIRLSDGEMLVQAASPCQVETPQALIRLKKNSLVVFRVTTGIEHCMDVWDTSSKSVLVSAHNATTSLKPGDEIVLTDHPPHFGELHQSDAIARRDPATRKVDNEEWMSTSEFSLTQAERHNPLLATIYNSSDPFDRSLKAKIDKMALIIALVIRHGPYEHAAPLNMFDNQSPLEGRNH